MFSPFLSAAQTQVRLKRRPKPEPVRTSITVVEKISAETPANVTTLDSAALQRGPIWTTGCLGSAFSEDRPASPWPPTTQGISLRGIGSSASRTLVYGTVFPPTFGGWVYWTQFVPDRDRARGGFARRRHQHLRRSRHERGRRTVLRQPEKLHVLAEYEFGNDSTHDLSAGFANAWSRFAIWHGSRVHLGWLLHRARLEFVAPPTTAPMCSSSRAMCASITVSVRSAICSLRSAESGRRHCDHPPFDRKRFSLGTSGNSPTIPFLCWASTPAPAFTPPSTASPTTAIQTGSPTARPCRATRSWRCRAMAASREEVERHGGVDRLEGTSTDHLVRRRESAANAVTARRPRPSRCRLRPGQVVRRSAPQPRPGGTASS